MSRKLKIKVCGMRDLSNIRELISLKPDYIGFIFYPHSKRYVKNNIDGEKISFIPPEIKRTGVFVDTEKEIILRSVEEYNLTAIQLHGYETPDFCLEMKTTGLEIFKALHIDESFNFTDLNSYIDNCDYFLFDTKTEGYGGSGRKFKWDILENYSYEKPFFLSGGIGPEDAENVKKIINPAFYAVDINSRFEISPGLKDIQKIKNFIKQLRKKNDT